MHKAKNTDQLLITDYPFSLANILFHPNNYLCDILEARNNCLNKRC